MELYIGNNKIIHSTADGVEEYYYDKLFNEYDTLIILRPHNINNKIIDKTVSYAESQIGKPYDFYFEPGSDAFFCTELVNDAYHYGGFHTGLGNFKHKSLLRQALHPSEFIDGNFKIVFYSKSLKKDGKNLFLNSKYYRDKLTSYLFDIISRK